jgi:hypothetical protein
VISRIAMPLLALQFPQQVEHLGLDGDIERRGRLVGDQQLRLARQRHRDHHPLLHAARTAERNSPRGVRIRDADRAEQLQDALTAASPRRRGVQRTASAIWPPTDITGFSEASAPGRSSPMRPPRTARMSRSGQRQQSTRPASTHRPIDDAPASGSRRMIDSAVIDLPQPDSPSSAKVSPRDREATGRPPRARPPLAR